MIRYCHPEFGCDCADEVASLRAEVERLRSLGKRLAGALPIAVWITVALCVWLGVHA